MDDQELERRLRRLEETQQPRVVSRRKPARRQRRVTGAHMVLIGLWVLVLLFGWRLIVLYQALHVEPIYGQEPAEIEYVRSLSDDIKDQVRFVETAVPAAQGVESVQDVLSGDIIIHEQPVVIISTSPPPQFVESVTQPVTDAELVPEATRQFWADCAFNQGRGLRVSPKCPPNAGELLGTGR